MNEEKEILKQIIGKLTFYHSVCVSILELYIFHLWMLEAVEICKCISFLWFAVTDAEAYLTASYIDKQFSLR